MSNKPYNLDMQAFYVGDDCPDNEQIMETFTNKKIAIVLIGLCCDGDLHVEALETCRFEDCDELANEVGALRQEHMFCCHTVEIHWRFVEDE